MLLTNQFRLTTSLTKVFQFHLVQLPSDDHWVSLAELHCRVLLRNQVKSCTLGPHFVGGTSLGIGSTNLLKLWTRLITLNYPNTRIITPFSIRSSLGHEWVFVEVGETPLKLKEKKRLARICEGIIMVHVSETQYLSF